MSIQRLIDDKFSLEHDKLHEDLSEQLKRANISLAERNGLGSGAHAQKYAELHIEYAKNLIETRLRIEKEVRSITRNLLSSDDKKRLILILNNLVDNCEELCLRRIDGVIRVQREWNFSFSSLKKDIPIQVNILGSELLLLEEKIRTTQTNSSKTWDFFISHASEDKELIARPLAMALSNEGYKVWFDEDTISWGDRLRQTIDQGLSNSKFGIIILSHYFFAKEWPKNELEGLIARESLGDKVILPIWHNITKEEIIQQSPILAGKLGIPSSLGIPYIVNEANKLFEQE